MSVLWLGIAFADGRDPGRESADGVLGGSVAAVTLKR